MTSDGLRAWLATRIEDAQDVEIADLEIPHSSGMSVTTVLFSAASARDGEREGAALVARVEPTGERRFEHLERGYAPLAALGRHMDLPSREEHGQRRAHSRRTARCWTPSGRPTPPSSRLVGCALPLRLEAEIARGEARRGDKLAGRRLRGHEHTLVLKRDDVHVARCPARDPIATSPFPPMTARRTRLPDNDSCSPSASTMRSRSRGVMKDIRSSDVNICHGWRAGRGVRGTARLSLEDSG